MPNNRITKRKDGRYRYKVRLPDTGQYREMTSKRGEKLKDFNERCNRLDEEVAKLVHPDTFRDLFLLWIAEHVRLRLASGEEQKMTLLYENHVAPYLGHLRADQVTRHDVYRVLSHCDRQGLSPATIRLVRGCISRPYNWAVNSLGREYTVPTNGLVFRPSRRTEKKTHYITKEELERFFESAARSKWIHYYQILYNTGLRPSEALGLQAGDLVGDILHISRAVTDYGLSMLKTSNANRKIPLSDVAKEAFITQAKMTKSLSNEQWLFPSLQGKQHMPSMNALRVIHRNIVRGTAEYERGGRNGQKKLRLLRPPVEITLYDFRHTFATDMVTKDVPMVALKSILGHESIQTTMKYYVECTPEMMETMRQCMSDRLS